MRYTYTIYLFTKDIEKYKQYIEIIEEEKMDMGSLITFYCENEEILTEIFTEK